MDLEYGGHPLEEKRGVLLCFASTIQYQVVAGLLDPVGTSSNGSTTGQPQRLPNCLSQK